MDFTRNHFAIHFAAIRELNNGVLHENGGRDGGASANSHFARYLKWSPRLTGIQLYPASSLSPGHGIPSRASKFPDESRRGTRGGNRAVVGGAGGGMMSRRRKVR
jgi:hypothetical protein